MNFKEGPGFKSHEQPQRESSLSRAGNTVQIVKPEGKYTVVYGLHFQEQNVKQLPGDLDCLVLETGTAKNWVEEPTWVIRRFESSPRHSSIFQKSNMRSGPIIFADPAYKYDSICYLESFAGLSGEAILGHKIIKKTLTNRKSLNLSRREFLRGAGKIAAGAWLSAPLVSNITSIFSITTNNATQLTAEADKAVQRLHPECYILTEKLRNNVIAHKEQYLMEKHGYSHIGTVIGAGHVLIEDDIQKTPEERLAYLNRLKPLIKKIVVPETFYKIVTNTYTNGRWESKLETVPDLKELITN